MISPRPARATHRLDKRALHGWAPDAVLRGKYRLLQELGRGAHGITYLAEHLFLNHPCVVKVLGHSVPASEGEFSRRLLAEARAGFRVNHPNVVRVLDCDVHEQIWFFVMEYVDGVALSDFSGHARLPWQQAHRLALDALAGLNAIHSAEIIHHDIKPGNLLLDVNQELRIADLGVANAGQDNAQPMGEANAGTLSYAAPELFLAGAAVDRRSDLYSLGATIYELVAGAPPFSRGSMFEMLLHQQNDAPRWPAELASVPAWFQSAVLRMLAPDPNDRFASALEAAVSLTVDPPSSERWRIPTRLESNEARGICVLPLTQRSPDARFDWVGLALTDYLIRTLGKQHGMYVLDSERLQALIAQNPSDAPIAERYGAAAGKLGAGTLLMGDYETGDKSLRVSLRVLHAGSSAPAGVVEAEGPLAELGQVESELLSRLEPKLGLSATQAGRHRRDVPQVVTAQELFARARQVFLKADYSRAIDFAGQALAIEPEYVEALGLVGVCHARRGDYDQAEAHHQQVLKLAEARHEPRLAVEARANLGVMYYFQGDYNRAHQAYARAAEDAASFQFSAEAAQINSNLGFVLYRLERPVEAEQAFRRAIAMHRKYGATVALIGPYNGLGNVLTDQARYEEAREYYRRALALAQEVGDRANIGTSHMHLGRAAALQGRFPEAKMEFALAQNTLEEITFWNGLARLYEFMADMNLRLGQNAEAVRCAERRIELAQQHENHRIEAAAWRQKGHGLEGMDRAAAARAAFQQADAIERGAPPA